MPDVSFPSVADSIGAGRAGPSGIDPADGNRITGWVESRDAGRWVYVAASIGPDLCAVTIADKFDRNAFSHRQGFGWIGFRLDLDVIDGPSPGERVDIECLSSGAHLHTHVMRPSDGRGLPPRVAKSVHSFLTEGSRAQANLDFEQLALYLQACRDAIGDADFIRRAYRYVLRREADPDGIEGYGVRLQDGLTAVELLEDLHGSEEFRALKPRPFSIPGTSDFPFYPQS